MPDDREPSESDKARAAALFGAYSKGWVAGAAVRPMELEFTSVVNAQSEAYDLGYANGLRDRRAAMDLAAARYGHQIRTVRLAGDDN